MALGDASVVEWRLLTATSGTTAPGMLGSETRPDAAGGGRLEENRLLAGLAGGHDEAVVAALHYAGSRPRQLRAVAGRQGTFSCKNSPKYTPAEEPGG